MVYYPDVSFGLKLRDQFSIFFTSHTNPNDFHEKKPNFLLFIQKYKKI